MAREENEHEKGRPSSNLPVSARSFSTQELEAVIRRAVELQSGGTGTSALDEGVSGADIVRIGQELGLDAATVRRALAEVRARPAAEESGALVRVAGERVVRASRVLRRPAAPVAALLERYLCDSETMVAQRRFPERTRYVRDPSFGAGLARFARGFARAHPPLNVKELDVAVSAIDAESCLLELSVDMGGMRGALVTGVLGSGSGIAAGWGVTAWATAIPDPLMLLAIPVVAGSWLGTRAIYNSMRGSTQDRLESLLDRVEHGELR